MEIYLDHAATTQMSDGAIGKYVEVSTQFFGNPNGAYLLAQRAKSILEESREFFATSVGAPISGTIFTSSGTEACNLAVKSLVGPDRAVLYSQIEHHASLDPAQGLPDTFSIRVTRSGVIDLELFERRLVELGDKVGLVVVMAVNNETGVVQPIGEVSRLLRRYCPKAKLFSDAVQAAPSMDLNQLFGCVDLMAISAHKFSGPKGVGVLFAKDPSFIRPIIQGGGQEFEKRSGTQDVASIAASQVAYKELISNLDDRNHKCEELAGSFLEALGSTGIAFDVSGESEERVPSILNIRLHGVVNEEVIFLADQEGIYVSAGAACASGALKPSHVLLGMGYSKQEAQSAIRVSMGPENTLEEMASAASVIGKVVKKLTNAPC